MTDMAKLRAQMATAMVSVNGQWIEEGTHIFDVKTVKAQDSKDGTKTSYIAELIVLSSSNEKYKEGTTLSYVESTTNLGYGNRWMNFLAAAAGFDPSRIKASEEGEAKARFIEKPESFAGARVVCEAFPGTSRGKGTPITKKNWFPVQAGA